MHEIFARGWENFLARLGGPMHIRFIVQPLVAFFLAARAGLRDARAGEPPFLWAIVCVRERRRERVMEALGDLASVLIVASALDTVYQLLVHASVYLGELLFTVAVLALVPYVLVRGPVTRLASLRRAPGFKR